MTKAEYINSLRQTKAIPSSTHRQAIRRRSNQPEAIRELAKYEYDIGRYRDCQDTIVSLQSKLPIDNELLGMAYLKEDAYELAVSAFDAALHPTAQYPISRAKTLYYRGYAYHKLSQRGYSNKRDEHKQSALRSLKEAMELGYQRQPADPLYFLHGFEEVGWRVSQFFK